MVATERQYECKVGGNTLRAVLKQMNTRDDFHIHKSYFPLWGQSGINSIV